MRRSWMWSPMIVVAVALAFTTAPRISTAHCDRVNGPVAKDARAALAEDDLTKAAIWVGEEQEKDLREAFERSLPVYRQSGEAQELAERYFMAETVRLHRAAEGFGFTGLKPAGPVAEDIAVAEKALETGDVEPVVVLLSDAMSAETKRLFERARKAREDRDQDLESGREWADAYVEYVIYVHGLHEKIRSGPAHGVGE